MQEESSYRGQTGKSWPCWSETKEEGEEDGREEEEEWEQECSLIEDAKVLGLELGAF